MRKYILLLILISSNFVWGATKGLSELKTVKFDVLEKSNLNNKKKEIKYSVDFKLPNKIKKEVLAPDLNKGEIYVYNYSKDKKIVYLPLFNETRESNIQDEENRIIKAINRIIEEEKKNKEFEKNYKQKKPQSLKIDEQITAEILSYTESEDYIFPKTVDIKDSGTKVGTVDLSNIKVNPTIDDSIFDLEKDKETK